MPAYKSIYWPLPTHLGQFLSFSPFVRPLWQELCATPYSGCQAVSTGCLDLCGKGPNVKVQVKSDQKVGRVEKGNPTRD